VSEHLTEAVPKPGSNPLNNAYLKAAAKEIEQTAVAVSVVGTAPWKLRQMAALADPVADALKGERPEVAKAKTALKRLSHNVRNASIKARPASSALRELAKGLIAAQKVVAKGLGETDPLIKVADWEIVNVWGYTGSEVRDVTRVLERASKALYGVGLPTVSGGLAELNPTKVKDAAFVRYDAGNDTFLFDPGQSGAANLERVLRALAERLWLQEFSKEDKETWGGSKGYKGFLGAFVGALVGKQMGKDVAARLQVTVGKLASKWPKANGK
jgi:hypothetical protein